MDHVQKSPRASFSAEDAKLLRSPFEGDDTHGLQGQSTSKASTSQRVYIFSIHVLLMILAGLLWMGDRTPHDVAPVDGRTWSPAQAAIEYEINDEHTTNHSRYSAYSGPPSAEQDEAWDNLMLPVYFNASREELDKAGESFAGEAEAELVDGGYLANIGAYHELHCLRQLRFYVFQERYYPDLSPAQKEYILHHLDHCLETLRLTIMCYGNTALYSFYWEDDPAALKPATKSNSKSVCVKWNTLEKWAYSRKVATEPEFRRQQSL